MIFSLYVVTKPSVFLIPSTNNTAASRPWSHTAREIRTIAGQELRKTAIGPASCGRRSDPFPENVGVSSRPMKDFQSFLRPPDTSLADLHGSAYKERSQAGNSPPRRASPYPTPPARTVASPKQPSPAKPQSTLPQHPQLAPCTPLSLPTFTKTRPNPQYPLPACPSTPAAKFTGTARSDTRKMQFPANHPVPISDKRHVHRCAAALGTCDFRNSVIPDRSKRMGGRKNKQTGITMPLKSAELAERALLALTPFPVGSTLIVACYHGNPPF